MNRSIVQTVLAISTLNLILYVIIIVASHPDYRVGDVRRIERCLTEDGGAADCIWTDPSTSAQRLIPANWGDRD